MKVLLRVDAGPRIGTGHMMRCLALAQACRRYDIDASFITMNASPVLERIADAGFSMQNISSNDDAHDTAAIARASDAEWIVLDGYGFDAAYQRKLRGAGFGILVIDDYAHLDRYDADLLLNQNLGTDSSLYAGKWEGMRALCGSRYALLREEFLLQDPSKRMIQSQASRILITLGGAAPAQILQKIIRALENISLPLNIQLITGAEGETMKIESTPTHAFSVERSVKNMPERMMWADLAITAAGSTSWEVLFLGLPAVTGILAENQRMIAEELERAGMAANIGWYEQCSDSALTDRIRSLMTSPDERASISERQRCAIDGKGADRVVQTMIECQR